MTLMGGRLLIALWRHFHPAGISPITAENFGNPSGEWTAAIKEAVGAIERPE